MDWNDLKIMQKVVEQGSLNGAAKALNVNHSTVYRKVKNLEQYLGASLMTSSKKGYEITPEGEKIYQFTKVMAAQVEAIELNLGGKSPDLSGNIRITAPGFIATQTLPNALVGFQKQHPNISFEIIEAGQTLNLSKREADIAIRGTAAPPEHLIGRKISDVSWGIFCKAEHVEQYKGLSFEQLCEKKWVGLSLNVQNSAAKWQKKYVNESKFTMTFNSTSGLLSGCENGFGLAILPTNTVMGAGVAQIMAAPGIEEHGMWVLMPKELKASVKVYRCFQYLVSTMMAN